MKRIISLFLLSSAILLSSCGDTPEVEKSHPARKKAKVEKVELNSIPAVIEEANEQPFDKNVKKNARVKVSTSFGDMEIRLYDETPRHRDNFLKLAREGFYDGCLFHRIIQGFMIQGGDPKSKGAAAGARLGSGGPGYQIPAELNPNFLHKKGALSAARTGGPGNPNKRSSGSQFYIVQGQPTPASNLAQIEATKKNFKYTDEQKAMYAELGGTPGLDMDYTVYGEVTSGLDVLDKIAAVEKDQADRPLEDVKMTVTIISE